MEPLELEDLTTEAKAPEPKAPPAVQDVPDEALRGLNSENINWVLEAMRKRIGQHPSMATQEGWLRKVLIPEMLHAAGGSSVRAAATWEALPDWVVKSVMGWGKLGGLSTAIPGWLEKYGTTENMLSYLDPSKVSVDDCYPYSFLTQHGISRAALDAWCCTHIGENYLGLKDVTFDDGTTGLGFRWASREEQEDVDDDEEYPVDRETDDEYANA